MKLANQGNQTKGLNQMAKQTETKTEDQAVADANAQAQAEDTAPTEAKTPEQMRADFETIAKRRMGNVLTAIGTLNGITNKSRYNFTPAHWEAMFGAIDKAVAEVKERLSGDLKGTVGFSFGDVAEAAAEEVKNAE